jgi:hypothetical protein
LNLNCERIGGVLESNNIAFTWKHVRGKGELWKVNFKSTRKFIVYFY